MIRSLILMSVVACSHAAPSLRWAVIAKAPTLRVDVERTQYIDPGGEHRGGNCYLHVRLTNTSSSTIGVDLRSGAPTIYPSCFGAEKDPAAVTVIDCIEEVVEPLAASEQSRLLADFRAHRLTELGPGSSADYFREFNGTPDGECDTAADGTVLSVRMAGELLVVGHGVEQVRPDDASQRIPLRDRWPVIPAGSRVISP